MTREEIESLLGPVDEEVIAELIGTGASFDELREAWGWLQNEEAFMGAGRPLPGSRVGRLIDLLEPEEDDV